MVAHTRMGTAMVITGCALDDASAVRPLVENGTDGEGITKKILRRVEHDGTDRRWRHQQKQTRS